MDLSRQGSETPPSGYDRGLTRHSKLSCTTDQFSLRHSDLWDRPPESSGEIATAVSKLWEYTDSMLLSLKQKFLKVRLTVPCFLTKYRTSWSMAMSQEHVISLSGCLQSRCHQASKGSATTPVCTVYREVQLLLFQQVLGCMVPCYCKAQWPKVCLSNAVPETCTNYNHIHIQTSPTFLRKGEKNSQQQTYPFLTLSHRDNQFAGAGTPQNAPVIFFLAV